MMTIQLKNKKKATQRYVNNKLYVLVLVFLLITTTVFSQTFESSLNIGVRYNTIRLSEKGKYGTGAEVSLNKSGNRIGYHANAAARIQFENIPIFIQGDFTFSISNGGVSFHNNGGEEVYDISMSKVTGATVVGVKVNDLVSIYGAPTLGYFFTPTSKNQTITNIETDYTVIGWLLGIGIDKKHFTINFRAESSFPEYGFTRITHINSTQTTLKYNPVDFTVSIGYRFGKFKKKRYVPNYN